MDTLLIGLGYKARQGKDTAAAAMIEAFQDRYDVRRYALADDLKKEVDERGPLEMCLRYGIQYDRNPDMTDPLCTTEHGKQSKLLQFWGQYQRSTNPFYWIKKLRARIESDKPKVALVPDIRHMNEFHFIHAFGGQTIKVTRHGFIDLSRDPNHVSETELDEVKFDYEIQVLEGEVDQLKKDAAYVFDLIIASMQPLIPELPGVVLIT